MRRDNERQGELARRRKHSSCKRNIVQGNIVQGNNGDDERTVKQTLRQMQRDSDNQAISSYLAPIKGHDIPEIERSRDVSSSISRDVCEFIQRLVVYAVSRPLLPFG